MIEFVTDRSALRTVRAFLAENWYSSGSEGEEEQFPTQLNPRPARLGLGAKYVPHNPFVETEAERRIRNSLRRQLEQNSNREDSKLKDDSDVSSDEMESKTASFKHRAKRKQRSVNAKNTNKKNINKSHIQQETTKRRAVQSEKKTEPIQIKDIKPIVQGKRLYFKPTGRIDKSDFISETNDQLEKKRLFHANLRKAQLSARKSNQGVKDQPNELQRIGKKKRKKRSRQKNLRKDKRTKSELPTDLTEKTLETGRVYRDEHGSLLPV